jgi:cobalt-zinc-cadmium efflux system membrane fusion protein
LLTQVQDRALVIPASAVQDIDGRPTVFVETQPGRFEPRGVTSEASGGDAVIRAGLREGERVAARGSYFLKGRLVQAREGEGK